MLLSETYIDLRAKVLARLSLLQQYLEKTLSLDGTRLFPGSPEVYLLNANMPPQPAVNPYDILDLEQQITQVTNSLLPGVSTAGRIQFIIKCPTLALPLCAHCQKIPVQIIRSWSDYCSPACKRKALCLKRTGYETPLQDPAVRERIKATNLSRYGVEHPQQNKAIRAKTEVTNKQKYGGVSPQHSAAVQNKTQQTNLERYGVSNVSQVPAVQAKKVSTNQDRYGVSYTLQVPAIRERIKAALLSKYHVSSTLEIIQRNQQQRKQRQDSQDKENYNQAFWHKQVLVQRKTLSTVSRETGLSPAKCTKLFKEATGELFSVNYRSRHWPLWDKVSSAEFWQQEYQVNKKSLRQIAEELGINDTVCGRFFNKFSGLEVRPGSWISTQETEILEFLQAHYAGSIKQQRTLGQIARETGQPMPANARFSLDLYLPELNLAIEHNGLYWHSTLIHSDPRYHLSKTESAEQLGIRLIHIWEDDWNTHRFLMESKLLHILGCNTNPLKHTRSLKIVVPTATEKALFYNANHIKGNGAGSVTYALKDPETQDFLAMITLKTTSTPGIYDLNRFATNINFRVPGAFSKLLKHFQRSHSDWTQIYTYADRCWSQGNVYKQAGFTLDSKNPSTPPAFHGVENNFCTRISRRAYTHERLAKRFPQTYDATKTQLENMVAANISVVWDCGNYKYTLYH